MNLLEEVKERMENEKRDATILYAEVKMTATMMCMTNSMSREQVIAVCADLLKMYQILKKEE